MTNVPIIDVNWEGVSKEGETYDLLASDEAVAAGYMFNKPVRLRFPDGVICDVEYGVFTEKGMDWLKRNLPHDEIEHKGEA